MKHIISILLLLMFLIVRTQAQDDNRNFEIVKNLDIYYSLFNELNKHYVDEINSGELIKTSIDQMLASLDPYTNFIPESQIEDIRFMTTGQYGGIGAIVQTRHDKVVIAEPYHNSPAKKAGLKAGDQILEIDAKSVTGKSGDAISDALKGQPQSSVALKIKRHAIDKPFEVTIVREKIQIDNVPYYGMLDGKIAYIKLSNFTDKAASEVKNAFEELKKDNIVKGVVIDLRGNPGGLLVQAVNIVNLFVPSGKKIVSTIGKLEEGNNDFLTTNPPIDTTVTLAVIVDSGSASASEIVAGAVQDLDRGVIIGQRTFGKGLVQRQLPLPYNTQLKVTIAKYYIPSGRCIQALDYSHRNPDGSVGNLPDSLISEFKTENGRKVYDGGGIEPDIKIETQVYSTITAHLVRSSHIFDFVTQYVASIDSIVEPEAFVLSDSVFKSFLKYLESVDFKYVSNTEMAFNQFVKIGQDDNYFKDNSPEIQAMKLLIDKAEENEINLYKDEISQLIANEIISRFYFQKGRIKYDLKTDEEIQAALKILGDSKHYNDLLGNNR